MTKNTSLTRNEFVARYGSTFEKIFSFDCDGKCGVKNLVEWELLYFPELNLPSWSANPQIFEHFLEFIRAVETPDFLVLTEVESTENFTLTHVVRANRIEVEKLWIGSHLPHFNTACFDESANWCALFDNQTDTMVLYRKAQLQPLGSPQP